MRRQGDWQGDLSDLWLTHDSKKWKPVFRQDCIAYKTMIRSRGDHISATATTTFAHAPATTC